MYGYNKTEEIDFSFIKSKVYQYFVRLMVLQ